MKQSFTSKEEKKAIEKITQSTKLHNLLPSLLAKHKRARKSVTSVTPRVSEVSQGLVSTPSKETKPAVNPAPEKQKRPSLEEGRTTAKRTSL